MADEGGVWRTVSGRRIFIRDGQSLSDAMKESGKFGREDEETQYFNRSKFSEGKELTKDIISEQEFRHYGLRVQEEDTESIGEVMEHTSQNWGEDFEGTEEEFEDLPGASTIGIHDVGYVTEYGGYEGRVMYLLGSDSAETGYDPGEMILREPTVLAKMRVEDGKLVLKEKVKTSGGKENKSTDTPSKTSVGTNANTYAGTQAQVNEYISFKFEMESKYGADGLWGAMSDSEYEKLERLERIAYRGK